MLPGPRSLLATVVDPPRSTHAIGLVSPALAGSRYLLLTTTKRDGTPVATPVWFAASGGRLVATTDANAWKVKRLQREPHATVAPCDVRGTPSGPPIAVVGEVLERAERVTAEAALAERYGAALGAVDVARRLRHRGRRPARAVLGFRIVR